MIRPKLSIPKPRSLQQPNRRPWKKVAGGLCFVVVGWSISACGKRLAEKECERLLDHYTERLLLNEHPNATAQLVSQKQSEARALAKTEPAFEWMRCADAVSRSQFDCAMSAVNVDGIEQCLSM